MSDNQLLILCIAGVTVVAILIILLSNFLSNRSNKRRAQKMKKDMEQGTYSKDKNYFGNQGKWETDETSDTTNAPPH